jgi:hypothetical protein
MLVSPTECRTVQTAGPGFVRPLITRVIISLQLSHLQIAVKDTQATSSRAGLGVDNVRDVLCAGPPAEDDCFQGLACEVRW